MQRYFMFCLEDPSSDVLGGNAPLDTYFGSYASMDEAKAAGIAESQSRGGPRQIVGLTDDFQLKVLATEKDGDRGKWIEEV